MKPGNLLLLATTCRLFWAKFRCQVEDELFFDHNILLHFLEQCLYFQQVLLLRELNRPLVAQHGLSIFHKFLLKLYLHFL